MPGSDPLIGQTISHYRVIERLGVGGMGVVYKAEDSRLQRFVALKFLPDDVAHDLQALARFRREAQAASALNHPNICTVYDVGEERGRAFIAMEYLQGQTLKHFIQQNLISIDKALDLAVQIADALDAAHLRNIIHRDIKPANIFVSDHGQVKVLDFGLAKVTSRSVIEPPEMTAATTDSSAELTTPGSPVGTVAYMSPEQVRGEKLDTRSDLFSFGVVLYEMATGHMAFSGSTSGVIFDAILNRAPVSPIRLRPDIPIRLEEIINKALEKNREVRYQNASDIRTDLQRLKRDRDSGQLAASTRVPATTTFDWKRAYRRKGPLLALLVSAVLVVGTVGYTLHLRTLSKNSKAPFQNFTIAKLTDTDNLATAAISPDGKFLVNVIRHKGMESLWLRSVATNSDTQLSEAAQFHYSSLEFAPDGDYIYYNRAEDHNDAGDLYRVPLLGGKPHLVARQVLSRSGVLLLARWPACFVLSISILARPFRHQFDHS